MVRRLLVALVALAVGCAAFTDLGGLSGGQGPGAIADASTDSSDAGGNIIDPPSDGGTEASTTLDGSASTFDFLDLFDRPNGPVGNAWIERIPNGFAIAEGRVVPSPGSWKDQFIYRPASENVLDVETTVEVKWSSTPPKDSDPTLMVRIQSETAAEQNGLYGYSVYVDDLTNLAISRIEHSVETFVESKEIPSPVNATDTYRLRLRVQGTTPVVIEGFLERKAGDDWIRIASVMRTDDDPERVQAPGAVGITSETNVTFSYDVFTRTNL